MWTFILVAALFSGGATAEAVRFDTPSECIAYAEGRLGALQGAKVSAHCVGTRSGVIITF